MWISKKKWAALEKRVADLEGQVQGQAVMAFRPSISVSSFAKDQKQLRELSAEILKEAVR